MEELEFESFGNLSNHPINQEDIILKEFLSNDWIIEQDDKMDQTSETSYSSPESSYDSPIHIVPSLPTEEYPMFEDTTTETYFIQALSDYKSSCEQVIHDDSNSFCISPVKLHAEDLKVEIKDQKGVESTCTETRPKKRQRKSKSDNKYDNSVGSTAVSLTREQLLDFSSEDLDKFVQKIAAKRSLTPEEEKEVKRQRRLIKNRESAMASRIRKKELMDELQHQVNNLSEEKRNLISEIDQLRKDNKFLNTKIEKLESVVKQQNILRNLWDNFTSVKKTSIANNSKAAGFCLMIVLLSFGLFFNNMGVGVGRLAPITAPVKMNTPIIEPVIEPPVEMEISSPNMIPTGRKLLQVDPIPVTTVADQGNHKDYSRHDKTPIKTSENRSYVRESTKTDYLTADAVKNEETNNVISFGKNVPQIKNEASNSNTEAAGDHISNVTYVVCNDVQVMTPNNDNKDSKESYIAVLVPPSSMGVQAPPGVMLQLMCKLMHLSLTSFTVQV